MSEVVVRMKMPERCYECEMADGVTCMATGGVYGREVPKMTWIRRRPDWCPIICQLPEGHGRLVDAESLKAKLIEHIAETNGFGKAFNETLTIVPAERSET